MKKPIVRAYEDRDILSMISIWNEIVAEGMAFPQEDMLDEESGRAFFAKQTHCGVAVDTDTGEVFGLYILHPNNVGRCGHIANASYAVSFAKRGRGGGEALVLDSLKRAAAAGFLLMQFNAVVKTNDAALKLYERLGFIRLGTIPGGFRLKGGHFEDIVLYYRKLDDMIRKD
jgi:L-amino acid N-acyltransferase YncA